MIQSLPNKLLLGRFLTRSGDQAWDFVVPLMLLKIFPGQLHVAALYFFLTKLLNVLLLPSMAVYIDRLNRLTTAYLGIILQFCGVILGAISIYGLSNLNSGAMKWDIASLLIFGILVLSGIASQLGATYMDIAIASDLVPSSIEAKDLTKFNSRLRQVDLFTEVTSPVFAGLLLLLNQPVHFGFYLVALWNVLSFIPELGLLKSVFRSRPELLLQKFSAPEQSKKSISEKLTGGWVAFFREPVALAVLAYAFLWLSVLSPHGVLLAGFLKDGWRMPEWMIGGFRGAGAFFGLLATVLFPWAVNRWGLLKASRNFIYFQALILIAALIFFFLPGLLGQVSFLALILLSRIGLYGFSLGEMEIRQIGIRSEVRGQVNGFASALTGLATLILYGVGTLLSETADFRYMVVMSVGFVVLGAINYGIWLHKQN
jgi:solute carrier family 40 (iron-regulated transporter), member 1